MQSFTTTLSQTYDASLKCDYPVCLQTSPGSLRLALLQHLGTVVQKGLNVIMGTRICCSRSLPPTPTPILGNYTHKEADNHPGCKLTASTTPR